MLYHCCSSVALPGCPDSDRCEGGIASFRRHVQEKRWMEPPEGPGFSDGSFMDPNDTALLGDPDDTLVLGAELELESPTKVFRCQLCPYSSKVSSNLKRHSSSVHSRKVLKCDKCDKTFKTKFYLVRHLKYHDEAMHLCDVCAKTFPTLDSLKQHKRLHDEKFQCETCHKSFNNVTKLRNHNHTHTGMRPYKCPKCSKTFASVEVRRSHMEGCSKILKSEKCEVCGERFKTKKTMQQHASITHQPHKDFRYFCGRAFGWPQSLRRHKKKLGH